ncbi:unnamed protein product [Allacma fusca]|uniref:Uncharacterized protein n=1 Tax=Allacma fusca TaxID=39272 RepID=A0A8J2P8E3_9HEXA|nr:unnamed protein product [Allacma fusca]
MQYHSLAPWSGNVVRIFYRDIPDTFTAITHSSSVHEVSRSQNQRHEAIRFIIVTRKTLLGPLLPSNYSVPGDLLSRIFTCPHIVVHHQRNSPSHILIPNNFCGCDFLQHKVKESNRKNVPQAPSMEEAKDSTKTFAERFAEDPVYGNNSPFDYRSTAEKPFDSALPPRRTSLDDLGTGLGAPRRPLFESRGLTPDLDDFRPSRPRLNFGERLLEAAGRRPEVRFGDDTNFGRAFTPDLDDPFEEPFFQRKKLLPPRSADAAFGSEDPFKKRFEALNFDDDEDFMSNAKKDTESIVAGFRSRMRARRQRDEEAAEDSPFESRVDKIRSRAKARLAELEDGLPSLSLRDTSRSRGLRDLDDLESSLSSNVGASKSLRISKRSIKTTVDTD